MAFWGTTLGISFVHSPELPLNLHSTSEWKSAIKNGTFGPPKHHEKWRFRGPLQTKIEGCGFPWRLVSLFFIDTNGRPRHHQNSIFPGWAQQKFPIYKAGPPLPMVINGVIYGAPYHWPKLKWVSLGVKLNSLLLGVSVITPSGWGPACYRNLRIQVLDVLKLPGPSVEGEQDQGLGIEDGKKMDGKGIWEESENSMKVGRTSPEIAELTNTDFIKWLITCLSLNVPFMSPHVWWLHPLWWIHIFFYWSWICKQVQTCENIPKSTMLREMREIHRGPTLWGIDRFGHFDGCQSLCIRSCFFGVLPQEWGYQQRR